MILVIQSLLSLLEHNSLIVAIAVIVGIIPHKMRLCKRLRKQKRRIIEMEAYLWHFTSTKDEWQLRITAVCFLSQRK
jgi:hypothetical protein